MEMQEFSFGKQIKETIQELKEIYDDLEKKGSQIKREGESVLSEFKTDIKNIQQRFEKIIQECGNENDNTMNDKTKNILSEVKPFIEKLIEDIKSPKVGLSDVIDISVLKFKLASIYTRIFIKSTASSVMNSFKDKK